MTEERKIYAVDSIEGSVVVLVDDDGHTVELLADMLPGDVREAMDESSVLRVPLSGGGAPEWEGAVVDEGLAEERLREAEGIVERLKERDPGGDVEM